MTVRQRESGKKSYWSSKIETKCEREGGDGGRRGVRERTRAKLRRMKCVVGCTKFCVIRDKKNIKIFNNVMTNQEQTNHA